MAVATDSIVGSGASRGLQAAWGIHLGLLLLTGSALYSKQYPPLGAKQAGGLVLVAVALIVWAALESRRARVSPGLRLLVGLGAALVWSLAHAPRVAGWAGAGEQSRDLLGYLQVNLGTIGVLVVFLAWLVYYRAGGEWEQPSAPLRRGVLLAGELVVVLGVAVYIAFSHIYGRQGDLGAGLTIFQALQFMALGGAVVGSVGGPLIRRAPAYYLAAGLLGVAALSLAALRGGVL